MKTKHLLLCLVAVLLSVVGRAQTVPFFAEDFEGDVSGWTFVNGDQVNQWVLGAATNNGGTKSAYISNDSGANNIYTPNSSSIVHLYRDIDLSTADYYKLTFDWKGMGENNYDDLKVYVVETSTTLNAGTTLSGELATFNNGSAWQQATISLPASYAGTTKRLVFSWRNDGSAGSQSPIAIDNIVLAPATPIIVTNTNDAGAGSLRAAINAAQDDDLIRFASGLAGGTITLDSALPNVTQSIIIEANGITISGNNNCQIMSISNEATVTISRVHFTNGKVDEFGGAISNGGKLTLQSCIFSHNQNTATGNYGYYYGSAIYNGGTLVVIACTFYENSVNGNGGVIYNSPHGSTTLIGNLFFGNTTENGGIVVGSTISEGYNVYDKTSDGFSFDAVGDKQLIAWRYLISPTTFRLTQNGKVVRIIPAVSIPSGYLAVDFYGNNIVTSALLAAGAVQDTTAAGYRLVRTTQGSGIITPNYNGAVPDVDSIIPANSTVSLHAIPDANKNFVYWTVNGVRQAESSTTLSLVMDGDKTVKAVFGNNIIRVTTIANDGEGSLRAAMNNVEDDDIIRFADSLAGKTITLSSSLPQITKNIIIEGNGITISGNNTCKILGSSATVTISRIHFTKGKASGSLSRGGGAIANVGILSLQSCIFSQNQAADSYYVINGGAIDNYNYGNITIAGCTFYENSTNREGGAIYNSSPSTLILIGNLFYGNTAGSSGDVIYNDASNTYGSGTIISGGYNVYDKSSYRFAFGIEDKQLISETVPALPVSFRPTKGSEILGMIPIEVIQAGDITTGYLLSDFYGDVLTSELLAAGAVQEATQSYRLAYASQGTGSIAVISATIPDDDGIVPIGSKITLQATPYTYNNSNVELLYWTINGVRQGYFSTTLEITMDTNKTVQAVFGRDVIVTTLADSGVGSLRAALTAAQNYDFIRFAPELAGDTITLESTLPTIKRNITIDGNGITISGNNNCQIMYISTYQEYGSSSFIIPTIIISRIHFANGKVGDDGGAINNHEGNLTLQSCIFSRNRVTSMSGTGAVINNLGTLTIVGCTFYKNTTRDNFNEAIYNGYADLHYGGTTTLIGNLFYGGAPVYNNAGVINSGGYNVYSEESYNFTFNGVGDKRIINDCLNEENFTPIVATLAELQIVPAKQAKFPIVDFYGAVHSDITAAGAVSTVTGLASTYTLSLDANGGTVSPISKNITYDMFIDTLPTPIRNGFTFVEWNTAPDGNGLSYKKIYTTTCDITFYAKWVTFASSDATLRSLTLNTGTLAFDSAVTTYTVSVANEVTSITVTGITNAAAATVTGNVTNLSLNEGKNVITLTVTAEDGTTEKTYTVTVVRASANKQPQTITWNQTLTATVGNAPITLTATASSNLTITYTSSNTSVATVSGNILTIVGAGTTNITASQAGNGTYNAATNVQNALTVTTADDPSKQSQTITWNQTLTATVGSAPITLTATASSNLVITYISSNTSVATVNGNILTIAGAGTTNITATQAGNDTYNAAQSVQKVLTVNATATAVSADNLVALTVFPNPAREVLNIAFENEDNYAITLINMSGVVVLQTSMQGTTCSINATNYPQGIYSLVIENAKKQRTIKKVIIGK